MSDKQCGATFFKAILPGHLEPLRALLKSIGDDIAGNPHIAFSELESAHFMSWFIVEAKDAAPLLFLEINVDGPVEDFLVDLLDRAGGGIDEIFGHCAGYPALGSGAPDEVVQYLLRANIGYDCYYICWRGLPVKRILLERGLRARLEGFLDQQGNSTLTGMTPAAIRKRVQAFVNADPMLSWAESFPPRPFLVRYRSGVLAALAVLAGVVLLTLLGAAILLWRDRGPWPDVIVAAVLLALVGGLLGVLRWHETHDSVSEAEPDHSQVQNVVNQENRVVQNHFASVVDLKAGLFRWIVLKAVLKLIHVLAAVSSNQGNLSGIKSIHFARWVVIAGGERLLFLSNYDGSWENYLDDFIDQASSGLTAIWSNTVGFPRTSYLVEGGARDELLFKTLVRRSQTPSLAWYSAYPDLSTANIEANAAIREGLFAPLDAAAEAAWLANF
jgi:hypothetical protein